MMGNIFGKFKNDFDTSMKYYEQALKSSPEDNITLNNIGATLMQLGKSEESKKFFLQAVKINNEYPNTHYALSIIAEKENDLKGSFDEAILALKILKQRMKF
ncbi:MAG: tetratricopeptide repeat protein [Ignavibacteria bacterium]|nr:tetratricopeptide repeat protein [Ignavibacteria bacterium]